MGTTVTKALKSIRTEKQRRNFIKYLRLTIVDLEYILKELKVIPVGDKKELVELVIKNI